MALPDQMPEDLGAHYGWEPLGQVQVQMDHSGFRRMAALGGHVP